MSAIKLHRAVSCLFPEIVFVKNKRLLVVACAMPSRAVRCVHLLKIWMTQPTYGFQKYTKRQLLCSDHTKKDLKVRRTSCSQAFVINTWFFSSWRGTKGDGENNQQ